MMINIAAFLSYALIANFSPGPNAILAMSNASRYGFKKSIPFNIGVFFGAFLVLLLCSFFSFSLFNQFPRMHSVMIWIGSGYLIWLAWQMLKYEVVMEEMEVRKNLFLHGLFLQFLNPNTILYGITVFSTFIVPFYKSFSVLVLFCIFLACLAFLGTTCWSLFGYLFQPFIQRYGKVLNRILAALLLYCAISLMM